MVLDSLDQHAHMRGQVPLWKPTIGTM